MREAYPLLGDIDHAVAAAATEAGRTNASRVKEIYSALLGGDVPLEWNVGVTKQNNITGPRLGKSEKSIFTILYTIKISVSKDDPFPLKGYRGGLFCRSAKGNRAIVTVSSDKKPRLVLESRRNDLRIRESVAEKKYHLGILMEVDRLIHKGGEAVTIGKYKTFHYLLHSVA